MDEQYKKWLPAVILVLTAVLSATLLASVASSPKVMRKTIGYLDERRTTVMEISAAAVASSTAITLIPGDAGSPVAEKLADLSTYAMGVLCAIFLEKYLTTVTGIVAFRIMVPAACILGLLYFYWKKNPKLGQLAARIGLFAVLITCVVPASVAVSRVIENTYETSMTQAIEDAKEEAEEIQENAEGKTILDQFLSNVTGGIASLTAKFEGMLNRLVEALAVIIVTSCIIPVLVLFFLLWLARVILQINIDIPRLRPVGKILGK